jgi:Ca2+-binding RTX toxin-like protein
MENSVFTTLGAGVGSAHMLNSAHFWKSTTGLAHDANDHIIYNTKTGALMYDADGTGKGAAVQVATLSNHAAITAADFQVI